jgi:hypothetical protein
MGGTSTGGGASNRDAGNFWYSSMYKPMVASKNSANTTGTSSTSTTVTTPANVTQASADIAAAGVEENKSKKRISRASAFLGQGTSDSLGMSSSNKTLLGS